MSENRISYWKNHVTFDESGPTDQIASAKGNRSACSKSEFAFSDPIHQPANQTFESGE
jgi:hypothetical protein